MLSLACKATRGLWGFDNHSPSTSPHDIASARDTQPTVFDQQLQRFDDFASVLVGYLSTRGLT
jgi:hypothetical protein